MELAFWCLKLTTNKRSLSKRCVFFTALETSRSLREVRENADGICKLSSINSLIIFCFVIFFLISLC